MEGIVIPDLKKKPRFLSKGAAQVPVLMHFQPSDTTMQTRRFYGAAARTIFERCEHRLLVELVLGWRSGGCNRPCVGHLV
jgi:hypothetical protein